MDDFYGWIEPATLYRILDMYPMQLPIKGGFVWAMWNYVFITSNVRPEEFYRKEVMDKLDPAAYFRRFHRVGLVQKKFDIETMEEYTEIEWQTYEDGVVPVEKPPCLNVIRETFSNPSTVPRSFFDEEKFKALREEKLKRLEVLKQKTIRLSPTSEVRDGDENQIEDEEGILLILIFNLLYIICSGLPRTNTKRGGRGRVSGLSSCVIIATYSIINFN